MPDPVIKIGWQGFIYRNTGTYAAPTWNAIGRVKDVNTINEWTTFDSTTKDDLGVETEMPTTRKSGADFEMLHDTGGDDLSALSTLFQARTAVEIAVSTVAIATSGSRIRRMYCTLTKFADPHKIKEGMAVEVSVRPTPNDGAQAPVADSIAA